MTEEKPKCCALCFGDRHLRRRIPEVATEKGTCSFCMSENQYLVEPLELRDQFEMLASIYDIETIKTPDQRQLEFPLPQ